jgi:hypothetical protein
VPPMVAMDSPPWWRDAATDNRGRSACLYGLLAGPALRNYLLNYFYYK